MLSEGITVKTLGGNRITISASAPSNPDTNDIWIASATGLISQWDGAAWQPFKFDASVTVLPGTVVAANIATATLTASLIAAGQVYAGFVDSTTVEAAEYIATSAQGEFLAYDVSSPTTGHLVNSIAGSASSDSVSNAFPEGFYGQQLTLANQASAPPAFSGASVFYSSVAGRPRYISQAGNDSALERSTVNVAQFSMGTQTTDTIISAPLNYLANEGSQSSEYEIEMDGIAIAPTSTTGTDPQWNLVLAVDGTGLGASCTAGSVFFPHNTSTTVQYTIRFRLSILTTGAGGTALLMADGALNKQGTNVGNATNFNSTIGSNSGAGTKSFDTTANHTLQVYANWSAVTSTGHSAKTYRTRLTRRM
jgi:hypothetical protein